MAVASRWWLVRVRRLAGQHGRRPQVSPVPSQGVTPSTSRRHATQFVTFGCPVVPRPIWAAHGGGLRLVYRTAGASRFWGVPFGIGAVGAPPFTPPQSPVVPGWYPWRVVCTPPGHTGPVAGGADSVAPLAIAECCRRSGSWRRLVRFGRPPWRRACGCAVRHDLMVGWP